MDLTMCFDWDEGVFRVRWGSLTSIVLHNKPMATTNFSPKNCISIYDTIRDRWTKRFARRRQCTRCELCSHSFPFPPIAIITVHTLFQFFPCRTFPCVAYCNGGLISKQLNGYKCLPYSRRSEWENPSHTCTVDTKRHQVSGCIVVHCL